MKAGQRGRRTTRLPTLSYWIGQADEASLLKREFAYALQRSASERIRRGMISTYKPVIDDAAYRIFPTMAGYRNWCEDQLPKWLGYGKAG